MVERGSMHPDQDLARLELGNGPLLDHGVMENGLRRLRGFSHDESPSRLWDLCDSRHLDELSNEKTSRGEREGAKYVLNAHLQALGKSG